MILYRNHYGSSGDPNESIGFSWHTSRAAALKAAKGWILQESDPEPLAKPIEFLPTKAGIVNLLARVASHPDNG